MSESNYPSKDTGEDVMALPDDFCLYYDTSGFLQVSGTIGPTTISGWRVAMACAIQIIEFHGKTDRHRIAIAEDFGMQTPTHDH